MRRYTPFHRKSRIPPDALSDHALSLLCAARRQWTPRYYLSGSASGRAVRELADRGFCRLVLCEREAEDPPGRRIFHVRWPWEARA